MEKLLKLLNEYNIELHGVDRAYKDGFNLGYEQEYMRDFRVAYLISKSFGFIKRLVDNDKIDKRKVFDGERETCWELVEKDIDDFLDEVNLRERLLMLLAISENPIEDLISYLK